MDGCKYCTGVIEVILDTRRKFSRKNPLLIPGIEVYVEDGMLTITAVCDTHEHNYQEESIDINFCPMCGKSFMEGSKCQ